jgi:hypothetical protein
MLAAVAVIFTVMTLAPPAAAQELPQSVGEFAAGTLLFADDAVVTEGFVGGAARFYLLPRVSVGPEIAYILGERHSHLMLTGNLTMDLVRQVNDKSQAVTPFVVVGGGLFRTRALFPHEVFTSTEGAFTAGGGARILAGKHVMVGAEARIGWELHIRLNGMVGIRLGRR